MVRALLIFGAPAILAYAAIKERISSPTRKFDLKALHAA